MTKLLRVPAAAVRPGDVIGGRVVNSVAHHPDGVAIIFDQSRGDFGVVRRPDDYIQVHTHLAVRGRVVR